MLKTNRMRKETGSWYASWFCTPYYHILYRDRDLEEASFFMDNLTGFLNLPSDAEILDLPCGRGRHSIYLNEIGYNVTGADLSESNIAIAREFENDRLKFKLHDMRHPTGEKYDAVLNLFTSFGYFDNEADNLKTIAAIKSDLKSEGVGVIDFMNINSTRDNLIPSENKQIGGINFNIKRQITNGFVQKDIFFKADGQDHHFTELVQTIDRQDFERYFDLLDVSLLHSFGNYDLEPFDIESSERLILIFN